MKQLTILIVIFCISTQVKAQTKNIWKDGNLTFITKDKVDSEGFETTTDYDAGNDVVGINMEWVNYDEESNYFMSNPESACKEICEYMEMDYKNDGKEFLKDYKSYYIVCYAEEFVVTGVIFRDDLQKVLEISVYCYEISIEEGAKILQSFEFTD